MRYVLSVPEETRAYEMFQVNPKKLAPNSVSLGRRLQTPSQPA